MARLQTSETGVGGIDYSRDRVQTSPAPHAAFENAADRKLDRIAVIQQEIDKNEMIMREVAQKIYGIADDEYRHILIARFIKGQSLWDIAGEMGYSHDHARRLSAAAIRAFAEKYDLANASD